MASFTNESAYYVEIVIKIYNKKGKCSGFIMAWNS